MAAPLYEPHPPALGALFGDLENYSRSRGPVLIGTPGSILKRKNSGGFEFYAHQSYDVNGKKTEKYLAGPIGSPEADARAAEFEEKIRSLSAASRNIRLLAREGFKTLDSKAFAAVAALGNNGLFEAGAVLVGSHAYGALLNQLGVRAAQYATQDVDIARGARLAFESPPETSFLDMLKESGIRFVENPRLGNRKPSTSFGEAGKSPFQVDLLVPSKGKEIGTQAVPELRAHATALPHLGYVLAECQEGTVLAKEGCCRVRVPAPERLALHKLVVSELRPRGSKSAKDLDQAAVLLAVLAERHPGALDDAAKALPASARKHARRAYESARERLQPHPRALETLDALLEQD